MENSITWKHSCTTIAINGHAVSTTSSYGKSAQNAIQEYVYDPTHSGVLGNRTNLKT